VQHVTPDVSRVKSHLMSSSSCTAHNPALQEKNIKHTGNITMDDIIEVARVMRPRSCAKTLAGTCKEMLGTAQSVGCTIDHQHPQAVMAKVSSHARYLVMMT
jgi:ribosomal protein L11